MFLSIIVPFYNSEFKADRLLNTISHLNFKEVEYIFVDDGSTDNTYKKLVSFRDSNPHHNISAVTQENKGPGGARNTGLKLANGKYVWFVDSDDDITSEAIEYLYANINHNYDFIEFIEQQSGALIDSMNIESGSYTESTQVRNILLKRFGRLHSKIFKRKLLIDKNIFYPEYCYYEDNPLAFIYPFHVKSFLKTDVIGYIYQVDQPSITRGNQSPKKLDRLKTAEYGLKEGLTLASSSVETQQLMKEFTKVFNEHQFI